MTFFTCLDVANFFVWLFNNKFDNIFDFSPMKLQKLTFLAQGWYLALYDEALFPDDFEAWQYGPVNKDLYYVYKSYGKTNILIDIEKPDLPFHVEKFLERIAEAFFHLDAIVLSGITHKQDTPWRIVRQGLESSQKSNSIIDKELIRNYYTTLINDYEENEGEDLFIAKFIDFLVDDSAKNFDKLIPYTKDMIEEDRELLRGVIDL